MPEKCASTGWDALDAELPGGGWPCNALTECLSAQPANFEWRLVGPALRALVTPERPALAIGPPRQPHMPGLAFEGLSERSLVWIKATTPAERLWVTEQLVRANSACAVLAWLPQARPEQIRRLQVLAQGHDGPVFLFRPADAFLQSSAAPLRVRSSIGIDWELRLSILKRRGPTFEGELSLPSVPGGLAKALTPRSRRPSRLVVPKVRHVVGDPSLSPAPRLAAVS
jgi:protein ImuA